MNESNTKRTSRTDWARVRNMEDEEIITSDIPLLTDDFKRAKWREPTPAIADTQPELCFGESVVYCSGSGGE